MNILIINPFGLGDVLFTTPLVRSLREHFRDACVGYMCNERVAPMLESNPYIDEVIIFSRGDLKKVFKRSFSARIKQLCDVVRKVRAGHYDMVFDLSLDYRYSLLMLFAGIQRRIGFDYRKRGRFLTDRLTIEGYDDQPMVEYYLSLLRFIDVEPVSRDLELFVPEEDKEYIEAIFAEQEIAADGRIIALIPGGGASWGADAVYKQWGPRNFARLADRLHETYKCAIVLIGSADECTLCDDVAGHMTATPYILCGTTSITQCAALLQKCALVIANDGGLLHAALSQHVPTVSLFGPASEKVYGPYPRNEKCIVITKDIECRPCYRQFRRPPCTHNRACLSDISVDEVFQKICEMGTDGKGLRISTEEHYQ